MFELLPPVVRVELLNRAIEPSPAIEPMVSLASSEKRPNPTPVIATESSIALPPVTCRTPALIVTGPVKVFLPASWTCPVPFLIRPPIPLSAEFRKIVELPRVLRVSTALPSAPKVAPRKRISCKFWTLTDPSASRTILPSRLTDASAFNAPTPPAPVPLKLMASAMVAPVPNASVAPSATVVPPTVLPNAPPAVMVSVPPETVVTPE